MVFHIADLLTAAEELGSSRKNAPKVADICQLAFKPSNIQQMIKALLILGIAAESFTGLRAQTLVEAVTLVKDSTYATRLAEKYLLKTEIRSDEGKHSAFISFEGRMRFRTFLAYYYPDRSGVIFLLDSANQWTKDFRKELATNNKWQTTVFDPTRFDGTVFWYYENSEEKAVIRAEVLNIDEVRIELSITHPNDQ